MWEEVNGLNEQDIREEVMEWVLVVELDLLDLEMLLFNYVCTPALLNMRPSWGVWGFRGEAPERIFWDVCWPTVCRPMVLGDP